MPIFASRAHCVLRRLHSVSAATSSGVSQVAFSRRVPISMFATVDVDICLMGDLPCAEFLSFLDIAPLLAQEKFAALFDFDPWADMLPTARVLFPCVVR